MFSPNSQAFVLIIISITFTSSLKRFLCFALEMSSSEYPPLRRMNVQCSSSSLSNRSSSSRSACSFIADMTAKLKIQAVLGLS